MINSKQKNKTNKQVLKERGSALILAVIVLVNALFIVVAVSSISIVERKMSIKTRNSAPAFQAADSGIEYVLGEINSDGTQTIDDICSSFSSGKCTVDNIGVDESVDVYFIDNDGKVITTGETVLAEVVSVRSVGKYGSGGYEATRAVEVTVSAVGECPDTVTDADSNVYDTVQIGDQCWMAENLNVGDSVDGTLDQGTSCSSIKKYCYDDNDSNCVIYGGLYQWDQAMCGVTDEEAQGICPDGWHIPTDNEIKTLEGTVDTIYGVGDPEWDKSGEWRGYDAGDNLKTGDFNALLAGWLSGPGSFGHLNIHGFFWTSSLSTMVWIRYLGAETDEITRNLYDRKLGFSVRCIKD